MSKPDIVIVAATRTPIGSFGGALKNVPLSQLATLVVESALKQSGAEPSAVGHLVMGNVIVTEPKDVYLSRIASIDAGLPPEVPAFNVNRLCGTGLQAVVSAAQSLSLGDCAIATAAGAESMSRSAYLVPAARWGARRPGNRRRSGEDLKPAYVWLTTQGPFQAEPVGDHRGFG
jgi:acetyl-CoA C-acetyltransferase